MVKMKKNILIINICKEKLHYYEFVKPIEDILKINNVGFFIKNYKEINDKDLKRAVKIIICGTSLKDNKFINNKNINKFNWLLTYNKPILGICGGMEIIGLVFNGKLKKKTEIGFFYESFEKNFLGLNGNCGVYHLHNYYIDFSGLDFDIYCFSNKIVQAIKHKSKEIYGVLFHPEVRQKKLIKEVCRI